MAINGIKKLKHYLICNPVYWFISKIKIWYTQVSSHLILFLTFNIDQVLLKVHPNFSMLFYEKNCKYKCNILP